MFFLAFLPSCPGFRVWGGTNPGNAHPCSLSPDTQPPLTPRQGLDYRGRVPDASPYKPKFLQYRPCSVRILQKKRRTTGKKALAYRGKGGQNTGTAFLALRLGVVLYLLPLKGPTGHAESWRRRCFNALSASSSFSELPQRSQGRKCSQQQQQPQSPSDWTAAAVVTGMMHYLDRCILKRGDGTQKVSDTQTQRTLSY